MSATQSFKPLSMANGCLTSLSTFSPKTSNPFLPFPAKPKNVPLLSCTSFLSCVSLKNKSFSSSKNIITFVARTSDWTEKEEENQIGSDEEFVWENQESDDPEARVSDWEGEAGEGEESVEVGDEESYPEPPEEAKLFVGNLPYDVDSEKLAQLFDQAGIVEVAEVIYNRETDQSRGFGFVTMSTVEEAEKAVEMLNRYDVNGRLLTVNKASPRGARQERPPRVFEASFRIYIGNLPWQVDDARLEQVFSEYGKVVDARVVSDRETGRSRGFGFVTMASKAELDDAIAGLDGQILDGRAIRVNMAEERPRRGAF